jgi:hypothetical protein
MLNDKSQKIKFDHAFYLIIWESVKSIKQEKDPAIYKELVATLKVIIQKYTNYPTQLVSKSANILCSEMNINPFELKWSQRGILGKVPSKNVEKNSIIWEHVIPLTETVKDLINCNNEKEVLLYLNNYPGTCLITRQEDDKLNEKYKSQRPGGWKKIYQDIGIEVIYKP